MYALLTDLRTTEGRWLLKEAMGALRPAAVKFVTDTAEASCSVPPTGQFDKWADCAALVREYERDVGERFNVMWAQLDPNPSSESTRHIGVSRL